ncbi:uncharacterized protein BCR38DRAFT_301705, partial [Pseudomassariella vexata]
RRRFAPVPIETIFDSYRVDNTRNKNPHGPTAELTPDPSPTSSLHPPTPLLLPLPKRKFAPQLIETSRRARRAGQQGPATKPTDKTDITPGTNHIYAPKSKPKRTDGSAPRSWATRNYDLRNRRESCDEDFAGYLLAVAAREAHRQRELEQAMSAFPNGVRPAGVEHFFVRDNSEDEHAYDVDALLRHGTSKLIRRKSTDPGWAAREMRQHVEKLTNIDKLVRVRASSNESLDAEVEHMEIAPPPEDPLWTTTGPRPDSRGHGDAESQSPCITASSPRPMGSPYVAPAEVVAPSSHVQPETTGFRSSPFGNPFAAYNDKEDQLLRRMRNAASPPMLGSDLKFRMCSSPKATRMEPGHPYPLDGVSARPEEQNRDVSGNTGLWRGYCVAQANEEATSSGLHGPTLLATPGEPLTPVDPFSMAFSCTTSTDGTSTPHSPISPSKRHSQPRGLHLLSGLDERLKKEQVRKDNQERIRAEFDDAFVTQVYNYISLGYPATARAFDEELSKISGIRVEELQQDDSKEFGKGFMLEMEMQARSKTKPPRWRALKLYIWEWARQHPDLDREGNPLAWGMRERRGSWAI